MPETLPEIEHNRNELETLPEKLAASGLEAKTPGFKTSKE